MFGNYITIPHLLVFFPLLAGIIAFVCKKEGTAKTWALFASIITLVISLASLLYANNKDLSGNSFTYVWQQYMGSNFALALDGMGRILTLLTALSFPIVFVATYKNKYKNANTFYGLMLLTQAGLMGVFMAMDALLFYFFWELALIPVYFLSSIWGGPKRIQATFKFFIYTFMGSLLMLVGIIYLYVHTSPNHLSAHSFSITSFSNIVLSYKEQSLLFWLFFIAFAIKMPVFPFHTWQPDAYEQAPTSVTMILSGVMVKMGVFATIRWLLPILPLGVLRYETCIISLSVFGMLYASLIAIKQDDLKRFAAYSSIAHIGLMCAAIFSHTQIGLQGVMLQIFSHGINIIGLWVVIDLIENKTGTRKISELGGLAKNAPALTILLVIIAFANIALPLTNAFVGEFLMFSGLFANHVYLAAAAGISIILAAVYTLNMVQKVFYGSTNNFTNPISDISRSQKIILIVVVISIFLVGIYPQPFIELTKETVDAILVRIK